MKLRKVSRNLAGSGMEWEGSRSPLPTSLGGAGESADRDRVFRGEQLEVGVLSSRWSFIWSKSFDVLFRIERAAVTACPRRIALRRTKGKKFFAKLRHHAADARGAVAIKLDKKHQRGPKLPKSGLLFSQVATSSDYAIAESMLTRCCSGPPVPAADTLDRDLANVKDGKVRLRAFDRLFEQKKELISGWLAQKLPGLPADLRDIAVSQSFVIVWNIVEEGGTWNEAPMASLSGIFEIAYRRAVDAFRVYTKRGKLEVRFSSEEDLIKIADGKRSDDPTARNDSTREERDNLEFLHAQIEAAISELPSIQQRVALLLVENYEDWLTYEELQESYHIKYNEPIPVASIKSAKVEIRNKLAHIYEPYRPRYTTLWHRISPRKNLPSG